jgi:hypothetical protein
MTETAKQGTTNTPAQAAETGSPQTRAAQAEPAETESAETAGELAEPDVDDTKRKFREALDRKHQVHNENQGKGGRDGSKINGAHGPAASRRNFRRKSG